MTATALRSFASVLATGLFAVGCAAADVDSNDDGVEASEAALANAKIKLPKGDPCREVLAPLSLGLADGAVGLDYARSITVSLTSETERRLYTVAITSGTSPVRYEVDLDNDSHSRCFVQGVRAEHDAQLESDKRTSMTSAERYGGAKVSVSPSDDDCVSTVKLLGKAVGVSAVGSDNLLGVDVELVSETEDRDYLAHVDGRSFRANGKNFPNDYDFELNVSNDSAFKCFVQAIHIAR